MRTGSQEAPTGHRTRVADTPSGRSATTASGVGPPTTTTAANFDDDNEWDIGIGNLIIDLDADIEKTNEGAEGGLTTSSNPPPPTGGQIMAANAGPTAATKAAAKMAIEHSATVDKGLKMKIKRTKPGTKSSEAKHEIVKSNEQNGTVDGIEPLGGGGKSGSKHQNSATPQGANTLTGNANSTSGNSNSSGGNSKRGSSGHRRDKARDKHTSSSDKSSVTNANNKVTTVPTSNSSVQVSEVNGVVRVSAPQPGPQRPVFPASTGPGPPQNPTAGNSSPCPPASPAAATAQGSAAKPEQAKIATSAISAPQTVPPSASVADERNSSSPPPKKIKTEPKVSTSVFYRKFS